MPSIKRSQVDKYNNQLSNGWLFDTFFYVGYSEKQAVKIVSISEEEYWRFTLRFHPLYGEKKNDFNQKFVVLSGNYSLAISCQKFTRNKSLGDFYVSSTNMKYFKIGERKCSRRNFSEIIHRSLEFTSEKCLEFTTMIEPIGQFIE